MNNEIKNLLEKYKISYKLTNNVFYIFHNNKEYEVIYTNGFSADSKRENVEILISQNLNKTKLKYISFDDFLNDIRKEKILHIIDLI